MADPLPRGDEITPPGDTVTPPKTAGEGEGTPSSEPKSPQEPSAPASPEEPQLPVAAQKRIDQLTKRAKTAEEDIRRLREEKQRGPNPEVDAQEKAAEEYLRTLWNKIRDEEKQAEATANEQLQDEVDHIASLYTDFNEDEVLKVMEEYEIGSVEAGYKAWKRMQRETAEAVDKTRKDIIAKPKALSGVKTSDDMGNKFDDKTIHEKSMYELAEEAKRQAGL